jgi:hypothetical protein
MKNQQAAEQLGDFGGGDNLNTRVGVGGTGLRAFFSLPARRVQILIKTAVQQGITEGLRAAATGGEPTLRERVAERAGSDYRASVTGDLQKLLEDPKKNKEILQKTYGLDTDEYMNISEQAKALTPEELEELQNKMFRTSNLIATVSERTENLPEGKKRRKREAYLDRLRGDYRAQQAQYDTFYDVGREKQQMEQAAVDKRIADEDAIDRTQTFVKGLGLVITTIGLVVGALSRFRDALVQISQQLGGVSVGKALEERIAAFINSLSTGFAVSSQRILETQGALAQEFGRLSTSGSALDLTKVAQSYGLTAQQLVGLERTLQSNALSASDALDAFREQGIVSGVAAEEINKNMGAVARAGDRFNEFIVEGIANAKRLGLEFGKIEQTLTGFATNFEGTVESFAQARALIPGFATDFSELFSVALDGSTDDLINIVREDLQGAGITSASELNRAALSNLEQATGFTADQIDRILANEDINFDAQMDLDANRNFLLKGIIVALATVGGAIVGTIIGLGTGLTGIAGGTAAAGALAGIKSGALSGAIVGGVVGTGTTFGLPAITGNDIVSKPGYGERTLVTPTGNIALNNRDTLVAGTELYGKGEISSQQADYRSLETRLDKLIMLQERSLAPREINITGFDKAMESQQQNAIRNY